MTNTPMYSALLATTLTASIGFSGSALAYGTKDAIRDCESRLRSEYSLSDFREQSAEKVMDMDHHYVVKGLTKVDDKKHPFACEIKERHVTSVNYSGPEPEGLGTAEKLAIGAAAAVAAGLIASEMSNGDNDSGASSEASAAQMKACKNAVAEKFIEASMADISVSSKSGGKHDEAEVNWTVDLHGAKTHGFCKVSADGAVVKVATTGHADNKHDGEELEQDGFYYDKHVGKWRDPAGDICHTCTPENGFPKP